MHATLPSPASDGTIRTAQGVTYVPFVSGSSAGYRVWYEGKLLSSLHLSPSADCDPEDPLNPGLAGDVFLYRNLNPVDGGANAETLMWVPVFEEGF